jgi:hypothetical protein
MVLNPNKYAIYFGFKGNMIDYEISKRMHRLNKTESKRALADIIILKYYFNIGEKINANSDIEKLLFFRYKNFTKKLYH